MEDNFLRVIIVEWKIIIDLSNLLADENFKQKSLQILILFIFTHRSPWNNHYLSFILTLLVFFFYLSPKQAIFF